MSEAEAVAPPANKKVVVHVVTGRLAGLRKIIGHFVIGEEEIVPQIETADFGSVQHAGTYPRYVLYRQFNPTQRGEVQ